MLLEPGSPGSPESGWSLVGSVLGRDYLVDGILGGGGIGVVYRAYRQGTGERFAIKVLGRSLVANDAVDARFRAEALIASALRHPGIVQVFDMSELPDGRPYIVMEYLAGEDLHQRLHRTGSMSLEGALDVFRQAALALHEAHRNGVVHRDIKPSNVFLTATPGGEDHVTLIDFGLARMQGTLADRYRTRDSQILGTPEYMPPEAYLGLQSLVDERSDQYSLALVLCHMLTGLPEDSASAVTPFMLAPHDRDPPPLQALPGWVSAAVREAIRRAVYWRKDDRFPSILDFVDAVTPGTTGRPDPVPSLVSMRSPPMSGGSSLPRLLIVEDDQAVRELLVVIFESAGFSCRLLDSADGAIDVVQQFLPHAVLLDVMLPGKSGYKLCWEIKHTPGTRHVPVLLLSGKVLEVDRKLGLAMKADAYVCKPFENSALVGLVRSFLPQAEREASGPG